MSNKVVNTLTVAIGAALLGSVSIASAANAFQVTDLGQGYQLVGDEAKPAGEAKCAADKKHEEGKCGEGKCGEAKKEGEAKGAEAKCGAEKGAEAKCGAEKGAEAKCGAEKDKAKGEGKCGEGKCGG